MAQTQALYRKSSAVTSGKTQTVEPCSRLDFSRHFQSLATVDFAIGEALDLASLVVLLAALCMVVS
jgi:hypothetical protein